MAQNTPLAAIVCAQWLLAISNAAWAQQTAGDPNNFGAGPAWGLRGHAWRDNLAAQLNTAPTTTSCRLSDPSQRSNPAQFVALEVTAGRGPATSVVPARRPAALNPSAPQIYSRSPCRPIRRGSAGGDAAPSAPRYQSSAGGIRNCWLEVRRQEVPGPGGGRSGQANPATYLNPGLPIPPRRRGADPSVAPKSVGAQLTAS